MSADIDPLTTEAPSMSHSGTLAVMAVVILAGAVIGFAVAGGRAAIGVLVGGILAYANFFWLDRSTRAIFRQDAFASTGILAAKYILRYVMIGLVLLGIFWTDVLPVVAVIAGLSAFAIAVVIRGLRSIFTSST